MQILFSPVKLALLTSRKAKPKNKAHVNPEKIAHHVHRIGHHFPNEVVDQACDWLGYSYRGGTYQKNLDDIATSRLARSLATHGSRMGLHGRPGTVQETSQQIRAAIRDLFPKIPDEDLEAIVKHAFREVPGQYVFHVCLD